jgi:hypothetical protein
MESEKAKLQVREVNLTQRAQDVGQMEVLAPHEKAKFGLAYKILHGVFFLFLIAIALMAWGPPEHAAEYEKFFDFVKTGGLSLVTLVIGSYFRGNGNGGE